MIQAGGRAPGLPCGVFGEGRGGRLLDDTGGGQGSQRSLAYALPIRAIDDGSPSPVCAVADCSVIIDAVADCSVIIARRE